MREIPVDPLCPCPICDAKTYARFFGKNSDKPKRIRRTHDEVVLARRAKVKLQAEKKEHRQKYYDSIKKRGT